MKIFVTGFMGSGKSSFGLALAQQLGYSFEDLDKEIEKETQATITEIFREKGEPFFREAEREQLRKYADREDIVIATGGGTPCFFDNMAWMNAQGLTVYLKLFEVELKNRLLREMDTRPLLQSIDIVSLDDFIYKLLRERAGFYHQAKIVIDPLFITPETFAAMLQNRQV